MSSGLAPSRRLGRYTVVDCIGRGGMGEVWLATVEGPGGFRKQVVLKMYDADDPHHRGRFAKEIAVLRRLKHCPFVPKLLHMDSKRCAMWISYCAFGSEMTSLSLRNSFSGPPSSSVTSL